MTSKISSFKQNGYVVVIDHGHPLADFRGRVPQHRKVMFDLFDGGPLKCSFCDLVLPFRTGRKQAGQENWGIEIDHIDADRTNNDILNLAPVCPSHQTRSGMQGSHQQMYGLSVDDILYRFEAEDFKARHPELFSF
jgi:hypothetical protein